MLFHSHRAHHVVNVGRMGFEGVRGCLDAHVGVVVDGGGGKCVKFDVHEFGKVIHSFGKNLFRD